MDSQPTANYNEGNRATGSGKNMDHPTIYGEPLSFAEIARREGLTLEQVKWEYRKGMTKLKHRPGLLQQMLRLASELHPDSYRVVI